MRKLILLLLFVVTAPGVSPLGSTVTAARPKVGLVFMFCQQEWLTLLTDRRDDVGNEPYTVKDGVTYIFAISFVYSEASRFGDFFA